MKRPLFFPVLLVIALIIIGSVITWLWAQSKPPPPEPPELDAQSTPQEYPIIEEAIKDEIELQADGIPILALPSPKALAAQLVPSYTWLDEPPFWGGGIQVT